MDSGLEFALWHLSLLEENSESSTAALRKGARDGKSVVKICQFRFIVSLFFRYPKNVELMNL